VIDSREAGRKLGRDARQSLDLAALTFVHLAQTEQFDDTTVMEHAAMFPAWDINWTGKAGTIMWDEGQLYRSLHEIGPGQNAKPSTTPSLWKRIGNPADEWPEWSAPIGTEDAYKMGDKVSHNGKKWICTAVGGDGVYNIWEPGVYGWSEQP